MGEREEQYQRCLLLFKQLLIYLTSQSRFELQATSSHSYLSVEGRNAFLFE